MHTSSFPRLFVESQDAPLPPMPVVTRHFSGRRYAFGPCEVTRFFRHDGKDGDTDHFMPLDWHGPDAAYLAKEILKLARGCGEDDVIQWFADEVLERLPHDRWEMSEAEVRQWSARLEARYLAQYPTRKEMEEAEDK